MFPKSEGGGELLILSQRPMGRRCKIFAGHFPEIFGTALNYEQSLSHCETYISKLLQDELISSFDGADFFYRH